MLKEGTYLKLHIGEVAFTILAENVYEILTEFVSVQLPSKDSSLYGLLYYQKQVIPLFDLNRTRKEEANIAIVCKSHEEMFAYMASSVNQFFKLTLDALKNTEGNILELDGEHILFPDDNGKNVEE